MEENEIMNDVVIEDTFEDEETAEGSNGFGKGVFFAAGAAAAGAAILIGRKLKPAVAKGVENFKKKREEKKQAKAEKAAESYTIVEEDSATEESDEK